MKSSVPTHPIATAARPTRTTWRIDPAHSTARFEASTLWGRVPVKGVLGHVSGELELRGSSGSGRLAIVAAELSSGIRLRDHHLRSGAFFDVRRNPEITFDASEVTLESGSARLSGELNVRGRPHPFSLTATTTAVSEDRLELETTALFDLDELGMSRGLLRMISPSVKANVRVLLYRTDS